MVASDGTSSGRVARIRLHDDMTHGGSAKQLTAQWTMIGEALAVAGHKKQSQCLARSESCVKASHERLLKFELLGSEAGKPFVTEVTVGE